MGDGNKEGPVLLGPKGEDWDDKMKFSVEGLILGKEVRAVRFSKGDFDDRGKSISTLTIEVDGGTIIAAAVENPCVFGIYIGGQDVFHAPGKETVQ